MTHTHHCGLCAHVWNCAAAFDEGVCQSHCPQCGKTSFESKRTPMPKPTKTKLEAVQEALDAAIAAKSDYESALSDLEKAVGEGDLDGLDELDIHTYRAEDLLAWVEKEKA